ncbi:hypothetical protein DLAC_03821 [Tieghemostelium lacteum]|uniref:Pectin lyase-like family protein n=1 Tax=Tieghemostelium lacteum TaxID=361077 RepID=A0A152A0X9_TIELA|nr:hypothetical protein DLAC_03821 [Tieghemostelium lacteum]|eukprot:KYQ99869.1 hypothetical protein DLAC_03821 [Tieghemostelium lacteum]
MKLLLLLLICTISLSFAVNLDNGCVVFISDQGNITTNVTGNCGTQAYPCFTIIDAIQSCKNQSLTAIMTFNFDVGVYTFPNETMGIYRQTITINGATNGGTIIDLAQLNNGNVPFLVKEPVNITSHDLTTLSLNNIVWRNLNIQNNTNSTYSFIYSNIGLGKVSVNVNGCTFTNMQFTSQQGFKTGSVFNLRSSNTTLVVSNSQFNSIQSGNGAVLYGTFLTANFTDCKFNQIQVGISTISIVSSYITMSECQISNTRSLNFLSVFGETVNAQPNLITNCGFSNNIVTSNLGAQSLIYSIGSQVIISGSSFVSNQNTLVLFSKTLATQVNSIENSQFISNTASPYIIFSNECQNNLTIQGCQFQSNLKASDGIINLVASNSTISNSTFENNQGPIITPIVSSVTLNGITTKDNSELIDCVQSNITIEGTSSYDNTDSSMMTCTSCQITAPSDLDISCTSSYKNDPKNTGIPKGLLVFIVIASIVVFIILLFTIIKCVLHYRRKHSHHHHGHHEPLLGHH